MKHATQAEAPDDLTARRLKLVEQQLADVSRNHVRLGAESRAQAAIIRRKNWEIALLGETLRRHALAYLALARVRDTLRPARVLDTGTPGVEVTR